MSKSVGWFWRKTQKTGFWTHFLKNSQKKTKRVRGKLIAPTDSSYQGLPTELFNFWKRIFLLFFFEFWKIEKSENWAKFHGISGLKNPFFRDLRDLRSQFWVTRMVSLRDPDTPANPRESDLIGSLEKSSWKKSNSWRHPWRHVVKENNRDIRLLGHRRRLGGIGKSRVATRMQTLAN